MSWEGRFQKIRVLKCFCKMHLYIMKNNIFFMTKSSSWNKRNTPPPINISLSHWGFMFWSAVSEKPLDDDNKRSRVKSENTQAPQPVNWTCVQKWKRWTCETPPPLQQTYTLTKVFIRHTCTNSCVFTFIHIRNMSEHDAAKYNTPVTIIIHNFAENFYWGGLLWLVLRCRCT